MKKPAVRAAGINNQINHKSMKAQLPAQAPAKKAPPVAPAKDRPKSNKDRFIDHREKEAEQEKKHNERRPFMADLYNYHNPFNC